jgi:hypothetical protein
MHKTFFKQPIFRSRNLLDAANGQPCIKCGAIGTTVAAHYQGKESSRLGKGFGIKPSDAATAELCQRCHAFFDGYETDNDYMRSQEFLMLVLLTIERRLHDGVLIVKNK